MVGRGWGGSPVFVGEEGTRLLCSVSWNRGQWLRERPGKGAASLEDVDGNGVAGVVCQVPIGERGASHLLTGCP